MIKQGNEIIIIPFRPADAIFHKDAESLRYITCHAKFFAPKVAAGFFLEFLRQPLKSILIIGKVLFNSRNLTIALKNISTIPKGFFSARILKKHKVEHIHSHWASTPSTVACIASYLSGISWSFTAHRWDIAENNLLKEKVKSASFVRSINEGGKNEIESIINDSLLTKKVMVIHMGVNIPELKQIEKKNKKEFIMICPANLVPKKGHEYLIEACRFIADAGINFKCLIAGDGPLEHDLKSLVASLKLESHIDFLGRVPHDKLIGMYQNGMVDVVVLPSIETEDGQKEGIPVALMEAMAYGIPVISTNTGGIPELIDGSGVLLPEKDPDAMAAAIEMLMNDTSFYIKLQKLGQDKVSKEFNLSENVKTLVKNINFHRQ